MLAPLLWALLNLHAQQFNQGFRQGFVQYFYKDLDQDVDQDIVGDGRPNKESSSDIEPPQLLHFEEAPFPQGFEPKGVPIEVLLELDIDTEGLVQRAEVLGEVLEPFGKLAQQAAMMFVFEPARQKGEALAVQINFNYVFNPPNESVSNSQASLKGIVVDERSERPLAQIQVRLSELDRKTWTDEKGEFEFSELPFGEYTLEFSGQEQAAKNIQAVIDEKKDPVDVRVKMRPESQPHGVEEPLIEIDDSAVVRGLRVSNEATASNISGEEAQYAAGSQGDAVKVIHTLPGVSRPAAGSGELAIWGAAPGDSRLYIDWVPVPRLFHMGGIRSIASSRYAQRVELVPGGFNVENGRAIGGMARVSTIDLLDRKEDTSLGGFASIDPIDVGTGLSTSISDLTSVYLAARRSLQKQTFAWVAPEQARQLVPLSDYSDYQIKLAHRLSSTSRLEIIGLGVNDELERGIPSISRDHRFREDHQSSFHRIAARLQRKRGDDASSLVQIWWGRDFDRKVQIFQDVQALGVERRHRGGLRMTGYRRVHPLFRLNMGLDAEIDDAGHRREGAMSLPAREGDLQVWGQHPGNRVNRDRWRALTIGMAGYVSGGLDLLQDSLTIEMGLRIEPNVVHGDRVLPVRPIEPEIGYTQLQFAVDPRLRIHWEARAKLDVFAAVGRYHQPASSKDRSPVFGNPTLQQEQAWHILSGINLRPVDWLKLEMVGFWINQRDMTARSELATPDTARLLQSTGLGRNRGLQATMRVSWKDSIYAWLSYSLMQARRKDRREQAWRRFDGDQTHVLQSWASWKHRSGIDLGLKLQLSSGYPRTPVVDAVFDSAAARYDPVFGPKNSIRLPTFFSLALRIGWQKRFPWGSFKAWLDVQNLTNHSNGEEFFYRSDYRERKLVRGIPIFPLFGLEVQL